jgi:hypothetical protein
VGSWHLTGSANLTSTYTLNNQALADGTLALTVETLTIDIASGTETVVALSAASATFGQPAADLQLTATLVTADFGAASIVSLDAGSLTLTSRAVTQDIDLEITGASALVGATGVSFTNVALSYPGQQALTSLVPCRSPWAADPSALRRHSPPALRCPVSVTGLTMTLAAGTAQSVTPG